MNLIDTHAHYDHKQFNEDRDELLASLPSVGVEYVINVGSDMKSTAASLKLAEKYPHIYASVGVHPHYASLFEDVTNIDKLRDFARSKKVVAYGEIGLDFFHNFSPPDMQREWFKKQLKLACELVMPVIIHSRDANDEVFGIIKSSPARKGVIHSFSGDAALAVKYIELGFCIGIGGVVTFKKADVLKEVCRQIPLTKMLLETDCPYLAPHPFRGKRCDSTKLNLVADEIARIKGVTVEEVCSATTQNAKDLFGIAD